MESTQTKTSLIIETTNLLGGGASGERRLESLERLLRCLSKQTHPLPALAELVITCQGIDASAHERCERAAGRSITFVTLPEEADYYRAKNRGFDAASGDIAIFADSDCRLERDWLEQMLAPFADPKVSIVAGRTTYRDDTFGR